MLVVVKCNVGCWSYFQSASDTAGRKHFYSHSQIWTTFDQYQDFIKKHPPKKRENGCWVKLVRFEIKWVSWSWKVIVQYKIQTGACTCGDFCWHRWLSFAFLWCSVSSLHEAKEVDFPQISWSQCALRRPVMWCCHNSCAQCTLILDSDKYKYWENTTKNKNIFLFFNFQICNLMSL